jgi:HlyD family secretion protein
MTDSVPKQKFERRQVQTGMSDGINLEIKGGVKAGDKVRGTLTTE